MKNWKVGSIVAGFILLASISLFAGQLEIEPNDPIAYRIRVVNVMGFPIRFKIMGYRADAHFIADLDEDKSTTQDFYAGQRVVCVWNRNKQLQIAASIKINRQGTLRLTRQTYGTRAGGETTVAEEALPTLSVEEE